jgi:hypothetical protein
MYYFSTACDFYIGEILRELEKSKFGYYLEKCSKMRALLLADDKVILQENSNNIWDIILDLCTEQ